MKLQFKLLLSFLFMTLTHVQASDSIWNLPIRAQDQNAKVFKLDSLSGHPVLATMVFTSCKSACPLMVSDLKRLEAEMTSKEKENIRFLLVSIDPENDTPKVLKEFASKMSLDDRWHLLSPHQDDVREFAAALAFQYKKFESGHFSHASTLFFMDKTGALKARKERNENDKMFIQNLRDSNAL